MRRVKSFETIRIIFAHQWSFAENDIFTTTKFFLVCLWLWVYRLARIFHTIVKASSGHSLLEKCFYEFFFTTKTLDFICLKWALFELVIWIVCTSKSYHLNEKNVDQASLWRKPSKWLGNGKLVYICFPSNRLHSRRNPDPFGCLTRYFSCFYLILVKTLQ